ncbi:MAG: 2-dehydropantoate 2-reductase [Syntrophorhabdaceae bacterium]|nr:2-dehydropantoate 2-reductase [Syntrophorhabdaceae bacterium]
MNIGIIGVGGVGGYFGGKICKLVPRKDADIFFVARGGHLDAIRKNGLCVSTATEGEWVCSPTLVTDRIEELPVLDVCLLCVKSYDLKDAVSRLSGKVSSSTLIVPLLNGIDIYERIREDLHAAQVLPACVYVGTHIEAYGKVAQKGGACKIFLGKDPRAHGSAPNPVFDIFSTSRISYEWFEDVYPEIWGKFVFIAAFGLVTAGFDKTIGQVMESAALSDHVLSVMNEVIQLAGKAGVILPETIVSDSYQRGGNFPYETKTSFQRDVESSDKPDERDLFGGTILRLGKRLEVDTPSTKELWDLLNRRKPFWG